MSLNLFISPVPKHSPPALFQRLPNPSQSLARGSDAAPGLVSQAGLPWSRSPVGLG